MQTPSRQALRGKKNLIYIIPHKAQKINILTGADTRLAYLVKGIKLSTHSGQNVEKYRSEKGALCGGNLSGRPGAGNAEILHRKVSQAGHPAAEEF